MILRLPQPPKALHPNCRVGWQAKAAITREYRQRCAAAARRQCHALPLAEPFTEATILMVWRFAPAKRGVRKAHDPDNLIAWSKPMIDSLQDAGYLRDDRAITYLPPQQEFLADIDEVIVTIGTP